ncbi:MAG: 1-(5-phosphoribosyl)-5-[(5-phosphoribosylamino)methylideneamino]imidazole-4-carboxamide isomerase [Chloroflexi bacterium]|nr:1-(5-phosphoribosyl)-5-[(5-phosphoribosylamino)methylideneamino]imidazole-4-carboxamide isomerase [Chloroflexota bacterium]
MPMIIFPAIDLRNGRVVRLKQGRAEDEMVYGDDPVQIAKRWLDEGAQWLHVVNLDGAFGETSLANMRALTGIISSVKIPVQFGGGLRDIANIDAAFNVGVRRVVIGTAAVENPQLVSDAIAKFESGKIVVGIDARDGIVATRGWREQSAIGAIDLARQMHERGVERIVYTDIARDGMLRGIDANAMAELARTAKVRVIASGGVASMSDVIALREYLEVEGVIIGQALYTGAINLREAIKVASRQ